MSYLHNSLKVLLLGHLIKTNCISLRPTILPNETASMHILPRAVPICQCNLLGIMQPRRDRAAAASVGALSCAACIAVVQILIPCS